MLTDPPTIYDLPLCKLSDEYIRIRTFYIETYRRLGVPLREFDVDYAFSSVLESEAVRQMQVIIRYLYVEFYKCE